MLREVEGKGCKKQKNLQIFFWLRTNGGKHGGEQQKHSLFCIWRGNNISMFIHVFGKGDNPITNARHHNSHGEGSQKIHSRIMFAEEMKACSKTCTIT